VVEIFFRLCLITLAAVVLLAVSCCSDGDKTRSVIPTGDSPPATMEEAPDDVMLEPGGVAYRANVHHEGEENPWPSIESTVVVLSSGSSEIYVRYRDYIETAAGEIRNNIVYVNEPGQPLLDSILSLYSVDAPAGIELTIVARGGLIGTAAAALAIEVSLDVEPGQYNFEIGLEIDGEDYGTIPCTIEVLAGE
jgi:hypothetical protein